MRSAVDGAGDSNNDNPAPAFKQQTSKPSALEHALLDVVGRHGRDGAVQVHLDLGDHLDGLLHLERLRGGGGGLRVCTCVRQGKGVRREEVGLF
jgi:hypothetical protein